MRSFIETINKLYRNVAKILQNINFDFKTKPNGIGVENVRRYYYNKKLVSREALLFYPNLYKQFVIHTDVNWLQLGSKINLSYSIVGKSTLIRPIIL